MASHRSESICRLLGFLSFGYFGHRWIKVERDPDRYLCLRCGKRGKLGWRPR